MDGRLQTYKLACVVGDWVEDLGEGKKEGDWGERFPFGAFLPPPPLFAQATQANISLHASFKR